MRLDPLLLGFLVGIAAAASGQVPAPRDETFELNISEKRIVETDFARSTSAVVQTDKIFLEAGTSVAGGPVVLTIRGVTGTVRFRARFDSLARLFTQP